MSPSLRFPLFSVFVALAFTWGTGCHQNTTAKPANVLDARVADVGVPDKPDKHGIPKSEGTAITAISAGGLHTCALTTASGVKCWGWNHNGQLGDGTSDKRFEPTDVKGLARGVTAIAAGYGHTCTLTIASGVKCWGDNGYGQLGDGTTDERYEPTGVMGLDSGVAAIATGSLHTCALTTEGGVKCWGYNGDGLLGDGTANHRLEPTDVKGLARGVAAILASRYHTCALTTEGGVKCWGGNGGGLLGSGTTDDYRLEPTDDVEGLDGVVAIAAGIGHTCALTTEGGVRCWGRNNEGQLGDGTKNNGHKLIEVKGLAHGVAAISAGSVHTCALTIAGGVKCWGGNDAGQLGDGTTAERLEPTDVKGLAAGVAAISAGSDHTCALTIAGGVKCWGGNDAGQLGDGTTDKRFEPTDVKGLGSGVAAGASSGAPSNADGSF